MTIVPSLRKVIAMVFTPALSVFLTHYLYTLLEAVCGGALLCGDKQWSDSPTVLRVAWRGPMRGVTLPEHRQIDQVVKSCRTLNKCYLIYNIEQAENQIEWCMLRGLESNGQLSPTTK